jgi:hypothetical protein
MKNTEVNNFVSLLIHGGLSFKVYFKKQNKGFKKS